MIATSLEGENRRERWFHRLRGGCELNSAFSKRTASAGKKKRPTGKRENKKKGIGASFAWEI